MPLLTYVPGKIYLAGPYNGAPLSMVAITSGVVGPFDVGTVVIRQAFRIDPETAEVFIDAGKSDPIPHIIQGIPVHARDIRAYVDRPEFTLNPTSCERTSTASTVLGSGLDFASDVDDNPITVTSPFQAADCAALSFDPKLKLQLLGGTKRGSHPAFKATLHMRGFGEAAIKRAQVTLPHSEFLENAHIKTICTRVQFKAGAGNGAQCPAGSVYGYAKATTPILSDPLTGPVFLRSTPWPVLPQILRAPAPRPGRRPAQPDRDRLRPGRPDRLGQGRRDQEHLRGRTRCAGLDLHLDHAGGKEGPTGQLDQPLQGHPQGRRLLRRAQRQAKGLPSRAEGKVRRWVKEEVKAR